MSSPQVFSASQSFFRVQICSRFDLKVIRKASSSPSGNGEKNTISCRMSQVFSLTAERVVQSVGQVAAGGVVEWSLQCLKASVG